MSTMADAEAAAEQAITRQFGVPSVAKTERNGGEAKFYSIADAIPYIGGTKACPICGQPFDQAHTLMFFLDGLHHDNVLDVFNFQIGIANRVEAMASRLANSGGENLFHEKDAVKLLVDMYGKGPAAVGYAVSVLGYYVTHLREYEATKRSMKQFTAAVLAHFAGLAEFLQAKRRTADALWGEKADEEMGKLWGDYASIELSSIRSMVLQAETLMAGEQEKVKELLHEDPMQWVLALAKSGTMTTPAPPVPQGPPAGVK
jgi:hypothetical protein